MRSRKLFAILAILVLLCGCASGNAGKPKEDIIRNVLPENGSSVSLASSTLHSFMKNYYLGKGMTVAGLGEQELVNVPKLSWVCELPNNGYTVLYSAQEDLSHAQQKDTPIAELKLEGLFVATTYYWQVIVHADSGDVASKVYSFTTEDTPRILSVEVSNVRDLGGYLTTDGIHRVAQGMVYRGSQLNGISEKDQEKFLNLYKIKSDLDLRSERDSGYTGLPNSPLGDTVQYVNVPIISYDNGLRAPDVIKQALEVFTVEENYPIYMHCAAGRDRGGTLSFLLNALLGVPETSLYMDYELTYLSRVGYQPGDDYGNTKFHDLLDALSEYEGQTINEKVENYCLSIGITQDQIQKIRQILLVKE